MVSEMTARERIAELLEDVSRPSERVLHNEENVDRIIAIVREALLSEQAKEAASYFASYDDIPVIVDSLLNAGLGTRFVTDGYDEPLGCTKRERRLTDE